MAQLLNNKERNIMQTIKAIYDGENFLAKQPIPIIGKYEVMITFIEPIKEAEEVSLGNLLDPDPTKIPVLGRLNGLIEIPDDFDEPLDCLREYMFRNV